MNKVYSNSSRAIILWLKNMSVTRPKHDNIISNIKLIRFPTLYIFAETLH